MTVKANENDTITVGETTVKLIGRNELIGHTLEDSIRATGNIIDIIEFDNGIIELHYTNTNGEERWAYCHSEMYCEDDWCEHSLVVGGRIPKMENMLTHEALRIITGTSAD